MKLFFSLLFFLPSLAFASLVDGRGAKGPIEITADSLEVLQAQNKAIFAGHVIAVQGTMNLKSDLMTVYYREGTAQGGEQQAISKIEVDGNVILATATETGRGARGVYDVDTDTITLTGDVVLTKDKNILKGASLVYNMATGQSVLKNSGGTLANGKPDRVRALFIPTEKKQ